jgi:hypothetical protein
MGPWLVDVNERSELDPWLDGTAPVRYQPIVMVVRGNDVLIREFLPNALDAAKLDPPRVVVWVKDPATLTDDETQAFFRHDDDIIAAVLDADHTVAAWVYADRTDVDDADFAFSNAQRR